MKFKKASPAVVVDLNHIRAFSPVRSRYVGLPTHDLGRGQSTELFCAFRIDSERLGTIAWAGRIFARKSGRLLAIGAACLRTVPHAGI
jgi:hypothetical protein